MRESIHRAFAYLAAQKVKIGISQQVDITDSHVEGIDLLSNHVPCEAGIALIIAVYSAIKKQSVLAGLIILGDLSIQGNIKPLRSLVVPLQVGMDNGARRSLHRRFDFIVIREDQKEDNMETSYILSEHIVKTRYEDLPAEVVVVTKRSILDTIGVILAASTLGESGVAGIISLVKQGGGREESTILGFGGKVVSWMAGFANGAMVHQLDYDDCHDVGGVHPGAATVPAALAVAERQGNISGKDFIAAIALGTDVVCRLSLPLTRDVFDYGFIRTGTIGKYGATVAAGKLLGLDVPQMVCSFGIVLNQASISLESSYMGGSDIRAIRDGFGAQAGIFSTLLSQNGVIGETTGLDGKFGLYNLCFRGDSDPVRVTANLGKKYLGVEVSLKPWACCRNIHGFVEAALKLKKQRGIHPEDIAEIVAVSGGVRRNYYEEMDRRRTPKSSIDAKFSLPFVLGVALDRDDVLLEDFGEAGRENRRALEIAQKVTYRFDDRYKRKGIEIGTVEIVMKDSTKHLQEVPYAFGHPENPIKQEDLYKKFRDCAKYSHRPLTEQRVEQIIETLENLEAVQDMREFVSLLV